MGTGFGSGGVIIIPITVWANKAVLAKAATRDRSETMVAGGGDICKYLYKRPTREKATRRIDDYPNKQAIQNAGDELAGFWLFLKTMASQETIAFVCVAQRNSDRMEEEKKAINTERWEKRPPKVGKSARRGRRVGANEREKLK